MMGERNREGQSAGQGEREGRRWTHEGYREGTREEKRYFNPSTEGSNLPFMQKAVREQELKRNETLPSSIFSLPFRFCHAPGWNTTGGGQSYPKGERETRVCVPE